MLLGEIILRIRRAMRKAKLVRNPQRVRDIQPPITWIRDAWDERQYAIVRLEPRRR